MWAHLDLDLVLYLWLLAARRVLLQPGLSHQGLLLLVTLMALGTFQLWDRGGIEPAARASSPCCALLVLRGLGYRGQDGLQHLSPSWLLHLGLEDPQQVVFLCFLALLILLIMKNSQEFIILL